MRKFRTYYGAIECFEVLKETGKKITYLNRKDDIRRELKNTQYQNWHDTWEEARQCLLNNAIKERNYFREKLINALDTIKEIEVMEEPKND